MKRVDREAAANSAGTAERFKWAKQAILQAVRHGRSIALTGLEHAAWDVQKAAIGLAEAAGAWVVRESEYRGVSPAWSVAFAQKGFCHATWSEIRQRSDALLLWYAPLWETHPRWIERFGPRSPRAHRLAVLTPGCPAPAAGWIEDQLIRVEPPRACEFLRAVRAALGDESREAADEAVRKVVHMIRNAGWLAVVRGEDPPGLADPAGLAESFVDLIAMADSEGKRRVVSTHVPDAVDAAGLETMLSIRAGLSTPMRFTPSGPIRGLGEWSSAIAEFLVCFGPGLGETDIPAGIRFEPKCLTESKENCGDAGPVISIPVGELGVDRSGTVIRADGVAVPVRGVRGTVTDELAAWLQAVSEAVRKEMLMRSANPDRFEPGLAVGPEAGR